MTYLEKAKKWLEFPFDQETQNKVRKLMDQEGTELEELFHQDMAFGTGGMRGKMGIGTNRLNKYTIGRTTQGLANYLQSQFKGPISVAIAYDVRHNSRYFSEVVSDVLSANGIEVHCFEDFRPTPELSFSVRELACQAGIVLTASHNPPEYNGYKVYFDDGAQIVPPQDQAIINSINELDFSEIKFEGKPELIHFLGKEMDDKFIQACIDNAYLSPKGYDDLTIVFTPIHGTSMNVIPQAFSKAGFNQVLLVEEQMIPSGDFPTVDSPNPEEPSALAMALNLAEKTGADIVIGTDPDADRLGIAVRDLDGNMLLLNGNQANTVLIDYILDKEKEAGSLNSTDFIGSTIVTSDIVLALSQYYKVDCKVGLTGFKWIAKMIKDYPEQRFLCGGEESYGFMIGDFVRDKDSVTTSLLVCQIAAELKAEGSSFYQRLLTIYTNVGFYAEDLVFLKKEGIQGAKEIQSLLGGFRNNPPKTLAGDPVVRIADYQSSIELDLLTGKETNIAVPKSNVLIFYTEKGYKAAVRPSGTEPKIKFYMGYFSSMKGIDDYEGLKEKAQEVFRKMAKDLGA